MMLLAVVVALIPYICPISPVTGVETATTPPWEPAVDEAVPTVRIVGGEITNIKKYPFIVCVRRAHPSHAHSPLTFHLSRASVSSHITRTCVNVSDVKERESNEVYYARSGAFYQICKVDTAEYFAIQREQRGNS